MTADSEKKIIKIKKYYKLLIRKLNFLNYNKFIYFLVLYTFASNNIKT